MGRNKSCTPAERKIIIKLLRQGMSYRNIENTTGYSRNKVFNAVKHFQVHGTCENVSRKIRPRKSTPATDRQMVRLSKADPRKTAADIRNEVFTGNESGLSVRTVRRRLNEAGLLGRIPRKKPFLSEDNRCRRLAFARRYRDWSLREWKNVLWTDETKITLYGSDGKKYIRRPKNKEFDPKYTESTRKYGGGSIMIWGCFSWHGVGLIHRIEGRMDQHQYKNILENVMEPFADENLPVIWKFQHDNDPKHTARSVQQWLTNRNLDVLPWPSCSPDLNPIEHLWHQLKIKVAARSYRNLDELFECVKHEWEQLSLERCQRLVESMPRRCTAVLRNNGHPTKY